MAEEKKELIKIRGANEHNLKNLDEQTGSTDRSQWFRQIIPCI